MIAVENEAFTPNSDSLQLIEIVTKNIKPDDERISSWYSKYASSHTLRLAFDLDIVKRYLSQSDKILEFGSVPPVLTASLTELGYEVEGVDIEPDRFSSAIKTLNLKVLKCNVERQELPFEDNYFNGVIFNEIFEHLHNLLFVIREVHRVMKPGGLLLLSTPNLRSLRGLVNFLLYNKSFSCTGDLYEEYLKLETVGHMGHVREYTSKEVISFLQKVGLRSKKIIYRGKYNSKLEKAVFKVFPSLKPFMTIVSEKL